MKLLLSNVALSITFILVAQNHKDLGEVVIEGKTLSLPFYKTSQNVQIISREEIASMPASSIEEVLSYYSGVDIRQRGVHGVQADVSIRGSSFEQVLILINGVRMNDSQTGHNSMNIPIDLASIERIEIVKGPSARRFGQNAYAGAINIVTRPSGKDDITASATTGDFDTYSLSTAINLSGKKFSQFLQAETSQSDGYRYNTDYQVKNVWYQNLYKLKKGEIRIQGGYIDKKFGANGFYSSPSAKDQYEAIQTSLVNIGWKQKFGKIKLESNAYWRRSQDKYIFDRNNPLKYRNLHIGNNAGLEANANYNSSLGVTALGGDFRKEYLSSNNLGNNQRTVSSIFFEHRFIFLEDKLDITPGISFADYSDFGNFWYPGIDVGYSINKHNKLFVNVGKTYRVPTYTDLNYSDPINEGNSNLKPENALSYELGYRFIQDNCKTTISLFRRESRKSIDWTKEHEEDRWKPENITRIDTNGLEIDFNYHFTASIFKSFNLGYTYLDNEMKKSFRTYSRFSLDNLRHQLVVQLEHKMFKNISNQIIYRYNDRVNLEDYHLVDDRITYWNKSSQFYIQMTNILNTKYTETNLVPMPGRWIQGGVIFKNIL